MRTPMFGVRTVFAALVCTTFACHVENDDLEVERLEVGGQCAGLHDCSQAERMDKEGEAEDVRQRVQERRKGDIAGSPMVWRP